MKEARSELVGAMVAVARGLWAFICIATWMLVAASLLKLFRWLFL